MKRVASNKAGDVAGLNGPSHDGNGKTAVPETSGRFEKTATVEAGKILKLNMKTISFKIVGTAPYLQCAFSAKARDIIEAKQTSSEKAGTQGKKNRKPKDYQELYEGSMHRLDDGYGIPAAAFRAGAIDACRVAGYKMTLAQMSIFVLADGYSPDCTPLVKLEGTPEMDKRMGRNANGGCDVRVRAIYKKWSATLKVRFDADQFSIADVINLFRRVGEQVGVGEGRPFSKNSAGMGFGTFEIVLEEEQIA